MIVIVSELLVFILPLLREFNTDFSLAVLF